MITNKFLRGCMKYLILAIILTACVFAEKQIVTRDPIVTALIDDLHNGDNVIIMKDPGNQLLMHCPDQNQGTLISLGWGIDGILAIVQIDCFANSNLLTIGPKPLVWVKTDHLKKIIPQT